MSLSKQSGKSLFKRPFLRLLAGQAIAAGLVALLDVAVNSWVGVGLEVWVLVAIQAILSFVVTLFLGLGRGWAIIQFILPWATWATLYLNLPPWVYLACFVLTYALYRNTSSERVPLYLSNRTTWQALGGLLERITDHEQKKFIDLGSGLGGTVTYLGATHPGWRFEGIESAPLAFAISWLRILIGGQKNVSLHFGDMWGIDLSGYNVVYAFLSPAPMARLLEKAKDEMSPGSIFVSNSFWVDEVAFDECLELTDGRVTKLYLKKM